VFGTVTAGWVDEAGKKPAVGLPVTVKNMDPKKLAVLIPVSREIVRANPAGFMNQLRVEAGNAFGRAFDLATLYDQGGDGTAGAGPFATFIAQTTKAVELGTASVAAGGIRADIIAGLSLLVNDAKKLTGFAIDERIEPLLLGAVDTTGRPIWMERELTDVPQDELLGAVRRGTLINRPSWMMEGIYSGTAADIETIGGDWTQAAWGVVSGIEWAVSTEASVTINGALVSAFENNLVIVRAEAEYGWLVNDVEAFVKYTNAA
jgi:HK97 family phage major capsid protein